MALELGAIGEPITCGADTRDKISLSHRGRVNLTAQDGSRAQVETLTLFAQRSDSSLVSIYMDRARVEELATYLMYWLHETKEAE